MKKDSHSDITNERLVEAVNAKIMNLTILAELHRSNPDQTSFPIEHFFAKLGKELLVTND